MIAHIATALLVVAAVEGGGAPVTAAAAFAAPTAAPADVAGRVDAEAERRRARAAVGEVLRRREFADLRADPNASGRWLIEWIQWLFEQVGSAIRSLPPWVVWIIVIWMLLALLAILAHLIYTLWGILGGSSGVSRGGSSGRRYSGELLGIRDLEFESVYAEARRLVDAGEWFAAARHLYVAAILWLDRQGWLAFQPAKTNRDYLRELRGQSELAAPFLRLTEAFEPVVYGGEPATVATTRDMATTVERLLQEPARAAS